MGRKNIQHYENLQTTDWVHSVVGFGHTIEDWAVLWAPYVGSSLADDTPWLPSQMWVQNPNLEKWNPRPRNKVLLSLNAELQHWWHWSSNFSKRKLNKIYVSVLTQAHTHRCAGMHMPEWALVSRGFVQRPLCSSDFVLSLSSIILQHPNLPTVGSTWSILTRDSQGRDSFTEDALFSAWD